MVKGIDTTFLIQLEDLAHPFHSKSRDLFAKLLDKAASFALTPQTLAEFVHVITDQRRFENPLDMPQALAASRHLVEQRRNSADLPQP